MLTEAVNVGNVITRVFNFSVQTSFMFVVFCLMSVDYALGPGIEYGFDYLILPVLALFAVRSLSGARIAWGVFSAIAWIEYSSGPLHVGAGIDIVICGIVFLWIAGRLKRWAAGEEAFATGELMRCGAIAFVLYLFELSFGFAGYSVDLGFYFTEITLLGLFGLAFLDYDALRESKVFRRLLTVALFGLALGIYQTPRFSGLASSGYVASFYPFDVRLFLEFSRPIYFFVSGAAAIIAGMLVRSAVERRDFGAEIRSAFMIGFGFLLVMAMFRYRGAILGSFGSVGLEISARAAPLFILSLYAGLRFGRNGVAAIALIGLAAFISVNVALGAYPDDGYARSGGLHFMDRVLDNGISLRSTIRSPVAHFVSLSMIGFAWVGHVLAERRGGLLSPAPPLVGQPGAHPR